LTDCINYSLYVALLKIINNIINYKLRSEIKKLKKIFTLEEAKWSGNQIGVNWVKYSPEEFRKGLEVELEHGKINPATNVTNDDLITTGKIAMAHLNEFPDYYDRLEKMEKEAEVFWNNKL
jgi:hypothetical protein